MKIEFPPATVSLSVAEMIDAVQAYLLKQGTIRNGGTFDQHRLGNLVATDLRSLSTTGSPQLRLTGSLTFELLPESQP